MKLTLPDKQLLTKTGTVDYFDWNYRFPIKYVQQYRFKKILELLGDIHYNSLLEIGTGSGIFLPELSKHCDEIYAFDIHTNFNHIDRLCQYYGIENYNLSTQNLEHTDYPDEYFDAIVAVSVLEFVDNLQQALLEIKRILKPGGVFITICPMENKLLDTVLSFYTTNKPTEEFGSARRNVGKELESNFTVISKGYMLPYFGKHFPIYTHYKLKK